MYIAKDFLKVAVAAFCAALIVLITGEPITFDYAAGFAFFSFVFAAVAAAIALMWRGFKSGRSAKE